MSSPPRLFYYYLIVKSILLFDSNYTFFEVNIMYYKRLRELREDFDLSQKTVAGWLGIDQRVYSTYETGKREIPSRYLSVLADHYKVSVDYILERTDKERSER